jgi:hypothetical protein
MWRPSIAGSSGRVSRDGKTKGSSQGSRHTREDPVESREQPTGDLPRGMLPALHLVQPRIEPVARLGTEPEFDHQPVDQHAPHEALLRPGCPQHLAESGCERRRGSRVSI